jgi:hypothetical protein
MVSTLISKNKILEDVRTQKGDVFDEDCTTNFYAEGL